MPKVCLFTCLLLLGCADRKTLPKNVEVTLGEIQAGWEENDFSRVCSLYQLMPQALEQWIQTESGGPHIPLVTSKRIRSLRAEQQRLAKWSDLCRNGGIAPEGLGKLRQEWRATHATFELLGLESGATRTQKWALGVGGGIMAAFMLGFVVISRIRFGSSDLRRDYDDE